jgi:hypothetical protein
MSDKATKYGRFLLSGNLLILSVTIFLRYHVNTYWKIEPRPFYHFFAGFAVALVVGIIIKFVMPRYFNADKERATWIVAYSFALTSLAVLIAEILLATRQA